MILENKNAIFIDVSELEAPAPLHLIIENLNSFNPLNEFLKVKHRIEPKGLYIHLEKRELNYCLKKEFDHYIITIWKDA